MTRFAAIAVAALAFAGAAQAQSITVQVAGKDSATLHKDIVTAAETVCASTLSPSPLRYYAIPGCVDEAVARAEGRLTKTVAANATAHGRDVVASAH